MYLGKIVESGPVDEIFDNPHHPYTKALLSARSDIDPHHQIKRILLKGEIPSPMNPPSGCPFHPRCFSEKKGEICTKEYPSRFEISQNHFVSCHFWKEN